MSVPVGGWACCVCETPSLSCLFCLRTGPQRAGANCVLRLPAAVNALGLTSLSRPFLPPAWVGPGWVLVGWPAWPAPHTPVTLTSRAGAARRPSWSFSGPASSQLVPAAAISQQGSGVYLSQGLYPLELAPTATTVQTPHIEKQDHSLQKQHNSPSILVNCCKKYNEYQNKT